MSTCQWKCDYKCYKKYAQCKDINGKCEWDKSSEFDDCVESCNGEKIRIHEQAEFRRQNVERTQRLKEEM